ncbi:MAG: MBL fold metallo-hydrolase [Anaerolineae bacterium]|nr:MBL fold metallo-hydrolase [Anaerolineales bacterium]MCQ3977770.1 MBL fold metallo-hydrolase [Anaerolineae bacterium]
MLLRYFYDSKLAHASYLVGCQVTGEAIVIDPGRDVEPYLSTAKAEGLWLAAATETHIHADFVSGARELAERAKVRLYLSDEGDAHWKYEYVHSYPHTLLKDGDTFNVGNIRFEVKHTPGHTPEHLSFLITDTAGANQPMGIFTGDFVFVGDVGRPDLLEKAAGVAGAAEAGARQMFNSLQRFKTLPDYLQLWPAHGAGSACGKALGAVPSSTVGYEKMFNVALSHADEATFVRALLEGQPEPPKYFAQMKRLNKIGPPVLAGLPQPEHLPFNRLDALLAEGAPVVDTRPVAAFATGHLPGTINIPYDNSFTNWAGWLLSYDQPFYLITDPSAVPQIVRDLRYIGLDNIGGYFDLSVFDAWRKAGDPLQHYEVATPDQIAGQVAAGHATVVDVRQADEWQSGHIPGAKHIMLGYLPERLAEIPADQPVVVQCRSGARSAIAASILQAQGVPRVINLLGGIKAWDAAGLPVER